MQKLEHRILASFIFFAFSHALILAQLTTATISGTAKDATGAVLPGVAVTVSNTETGLVRTAITDDEGRYRAPQLPLGNYQVEAELVGFQREIRSGITLTMDREAIIDFTLKVGEITESVTVSSEPALIETTSSSLGGLIDDRQIRNMPLNGRSIGQLTALEVGVTISRASTTPETSFNIGGARRYQTKILMDNSDISSLNNEMPTSVAGVFLGVEAVREFKVQVNNFSAEFGGSGGVVSAVTRSGTNAFHGSLLEFHRNSAFDARNFFNPGNAPPPFKRNQFGASFGGPIKRNKTFFFVNYEGLRDRANNINIRNVPTELAKQGILPPNRTVQVHPNIRPYLALLPPPNGRDNGDGTGEYVASVKSPADDDFFLVRIDHNFSSKDSLYGRYTIDDAINSTPTNPPIIKRTNKSRSQYFVLEETRILTPTLLNVFHLGFNRSGGSGPCEQMVAIPSSLDLIPGRPFGTSGGFLMTALNITALVECNTALRTDAFNVYEYGDNLSWNTGRHSLKSGLLVKNLRYNVNNSTEYGGVYTFTTMERLLTGRPNAFLAMFPGTDATRSWRQTLYGFFIQEDFKLKQNLTFNLGLRYEFTTAPIEAHGRSARLLDVLDPTTTVSGRGPYVETSKKDFAPRVGFAWDPTGRGKLSIRGGFGIFFEPLMPYAYGYVPGVRTPPFFQRVNISNPPYPNAFQVLDQFAATLAIITFADYNTPYSTQYNLNVQRELAQGLVLSAAYIGSRGLNMLRVSDQNTAKPVIQPDGRKFFPVNAARRNPNFTEVLNSTTDARSWYNAMGISVRKRLSGGNHFQLSYTTGKMLDNASLKSNPEGSQNTNRNTMDPYDLNRDYSLSTHHVAHNLVFNYTYELPLGQGHRFGGNLPAFAHKLVSGWQFNGITTLASGTPFNVQIGHNAARDGQATSGATFQQRPDLAPGKSNNPVLGGPDKYLDAGAFLVPEPGYYGNLGRNTAMGPKYANLDFGLTKNTAVGEGKELEFRVEMFNAFNHANFGVPGRFVFNDASGVPVGSFGRIINTVNTARQIQLGLKFTF